VSHDHAGSLLDHRIPGDPDVHEVIRGLLVTDALGIPLPADDRLRVDLAGTTVPALPTWAVATWCSTPAPTSRPARWRSINGPQRPARWPPPAGGSP